MNEKLSEILQGKSLYLEELNICYWLLWLTEVL